MHTESAFLKNTWYVTAWSHEVGADTMLARTIAGVPLLLWRDHAGPVAALEDRCCHRAAPLSKGRREGDRIRCMYHGLLFDATGRCIEIPSQDFIPPAARVRAFPIVERFKWIWVWMGDPHKADPTLIPDTHYLDDPGWRGIPDHMHYAANYLLVTDNLLDFSHLSYVLIGEGPAQQGAKTRQRGIHAHRANSGVVSPVRNSVLTTRCDAAAYAAWDFQGRLLKGD